MSAWLLAIAVALAGQQVTPGPPRPAQQAQPQTAHTGTAAIRGRILAGDTNRPLRRAQVTLSAPELGNQPRVANTNAEGQYEVKDLPAGRYTLLVRRSGYLPLRYGQRRPLEQAKPLQVLDQQVVEHVDFVLPRMGLITGRVFDEVNEPIAGVKVFAMRPIYIDNRRQLLPVGDAVGVETDDAGQYRIADLVPGTYVVMAMTDETWTVVKDGHRNVMGFLTTYFPGVADAAESKRVAVGVGGRIPAVDFALIPSRTATISGVAFDSSGRPLAGSVTLVEQFRSSSGGTGFSSLGNWSSSGTGGSFLFTGVPAGEYNVRAQTGSGAARREEGFVTVAVNGVDIKDLVVTTSAGWSLGGRIVTEAGVAPEIPRSAVRVAARLVADQSSRPGMGFGQVKDDLTFSVENVMAPARLVITLPDTWMVREILDGGRDISDVPLNLKSGEVRNNLEVVVTDHVTSVGGLLTDNNGAPISEGSVVVFAANARQWGENSRFVRSTRVDQDGKYEIRGLPPGEYLAAAFDYVEDGSWNDPDYLESIRQHGQRFTLTESQSKALTLKVVAVGPSKLGPYETPVSSVPSVVQNWK